MPRGQWSEENLKLAVRSVLVDGLPKKAAARRYGIPRPTLQRHVQSAQNGLGIEKRFGRHCVLTAEQEEDLVSRLLDMEARFYGLRPMDVRSIVYRFCVQNKIQHTFSELKQMAGKKWMQSFMMRHKQFTGSNKLICGFIDLIPIPKNDRISTNGRTRRAVAHASVVTNKVFTR